MSENDHTQKRMNEKIKMFFTTLEFSLAVQVAGRYDISVEAILKSCDDRVSQLVCITF